MIEQQQHLVLKVLTPLLSPDSRLTAIEQVALKAALQMVMCNPVMATDYAAALQLLTDAQERLNQKRRR